MEIVIIAIVAVIVFAAFEISSIRGYKKTIAEQKRIIEEQSEFIKVLEKDYDIVIKDQFKNIKNKINGK